MTLFGRLLVLKDFTDLPRKDLLRKVELMHYFVEYLLKFIARLPFLGEGQKHLITFSTIYEL